MTPVRGVVSDDGAAPRSDGRVEGLDAAHHPRLSHHRRQQGAHEQLDINFVCAECVEENCDCIYSAT